MKIKAYQILGLNAVFSKFSYAKAPAALVVQMMKNKVALEGEVSIINQVKSHLANSCRPEMPEDSPGFDEIWDKAFAPLQISFLESDREIDIKKISEKDLDLLIRPILEKITSDDLSIISLITELK